MFNTNAEAMTIQQTIVKMDFTKFFIIIFFDCYFFFLLASLEGENIYGH